MTDLPAGWASTNVRDVSAAMFDGPFGSALKTSDYTDDGMRVARLENIGHLEFRRDLKSYVSASKGQGLSRHLLRRADVLFSSFVDRQTRVCLVPDDLDGRMINKADCFCVRVNSAVCDPRFVAYRLAAPSAYETFAGAVKGVTRPRIGMRDLAAFEMELPPLAEQRRIVAKLDALTARTARARADLDRVPALAERQRRAVLVEAFSGRLTRAWRQGLEPSRRGETQYASLDLDGSERGDWPFDQLPVGWAWEAFAAVFDDVTHSTRKLPTKEYRIEGRFPIVDQGEIFVPGYTDREEMLHPSPPPYVVFGDHTRCVKLVERQFVQGADGVKVLLPRPKIQARFAAYALQALELPDKGYSRHMKFLRASYFPLCTQEEQQEIVRRIETAFAEIDRLVAEAAAARRQLDRLDQAILAKAFRGELVPQDPADEPASVLLDRIRAERAASPAKARRARKAEPV